MFHQKITKLLTLSISCIFLSIQPAFAQDSSATKYQHELKLKLNEQIVTVNGQTQTLPVPPTLMNSVTMVPLRFIAETLGVTVQWDDVTRIIILSTAKTKISLAIDSKDAVINGASTSLEQPATILNDTTMVPLRFIAENMDQTVSFDGTTQMITITNKLIQPTPVNEKRDKPTVDNLSIERPITERSNVKIEDIISDSKSNLYMIDFDVKSQSYPYGILSYNQNNGDGKNIQHTTFIDSKFDVQYKDSKGAVQRVSYQNITPKKLYYDSLTDKLYLMAHAARPFVEEAVIIYEILPEVKMVTYNLESSMNEENNFISFLDQDHFYYSNAFSGKIFDFQAPNESKVIGFLPEKKASYVSLNTDGKMYILDKTNKKISKVNLDGTITEVARVNLGQITGASSRNGYFYISDTTRIYQVDVAGKMDEYTNVALLTYNKGLYDPKTQTYEQPAVNDKIVDGKSVTDQVEGPGALSFKGSFLFTIDHHGNIVIYDSLNGIIRRINVY
ncbi:stalk domain-containing protein [Paenibacillus sp. P36]|uniref:stalk domain-containing protein n=1 Tax=Paenibacillus sp. P36 TaxID=3342538 RepID=UPI0038B3660B